MVHVVVAVPCSEAVVATLTQAKPRDFKILPWLKPNDHVESARMF